MFSRRAIDALDEAYRTPPGALGTECFSGDDLDPEQVDLIEAVVKDRAGALPAWRRAQVRELGFWRWTAFNGYAGRDPRSLPLHQEHLMVSTFYRTGWTMAEFGDAVVVEIGCGPLGMVEFLPGGERYGFDPLNDAYQRLFSRFRVRGVSYLNDLAQLLDHTADPALLFNTMFAKTKPGGRFILQVNLTRPDVPRSPEHREMHPSPMTQRQIAAWLGAKSDDFQHHCETEATADGEFYSLAWGTKARDETVSYDPAEAAPAGSPRAWWRQLSGELRRRG